MDKLIESLGKIADNVWAFALFGLSAIVAIIAHFSHDKDLLTFAGTISMTGAALFHGKDKSSQ